MDVGNRETHGAVSDTASVGTGRFVAHEKSNPIKGVRVIRFLGQALRCAPFLLSTDSKPVTITSRDFLWPL